MYCTISLHIIKYLFLIVQNPLFAQLHLRCFISLAWLSSPMVSSSYFSVEKDILIKHIFISESLRQNFSRYLNTNLDTGSSSWVYGSADVTWESLWVQPLSRDQGKSVFSPVKNRATCFRISQLPAGPDVFPWLAKGFCLPLSCCCDSLCLHPGSTKTHPRPPQKGLVAAFLAMGR